MPQHSRAHILFIGNDATRSGVPIMMLDHLRGLSDSGEWTIDVVLNHGGELEPEFARIAPTVCLDRVAGGVHPVARRRLHRFAGKLAVWADRRAVARIVRARAPSLVYVHSAANAEAADALPEQLASPVICHIHELEYTLREEIREQRFARVKRRGTHFIAASQAVRDNLIRNHGIACAAVDVAYSFVRANDLATLVTDRDATRRAIGVPSDAMIVAGAGVVGWKKGTELMVQLARIVRERATGLPPVHFVWAGWGERSVPGIQILRDAEFAGVADRVHLIGPTDNLPAILGAADVFVLPSREDSFPLVCLEAAAMGKPIVCFAGAGGMPEFVGNDECGKVVPYMDVSGMGDALIALLSNPTERARAAAQAQKRARAGHDVSVVVPQLTDIMRRLVARRGGT